MSKSSYIELAQKEENIKFNVLATYENNNKNYVIYTDEKENVAGLKNIYAGIIKGDKLLPVTDDYDLQLVENLINKLDEVK